MGIIDEDKLASGIEKRNLAKYPLFPESLKALSEYPEKFNTNYSDHFGFRELLTKIYFKLVYYLGIQSAIDDVTFGQDDWLFLGSIKKGYQKYDDPIGDVMNVDLYTQRELADFVSSIVAIKNWLGNKGIEYVYVIAPNKHTIYFENLPKYISKQNNKSSTDQVLEYLQKHTDVAVVDLRPPLFAEKIKNQVYFKYDTHWNQYGANAAQYEIMKKVKSLFPGKIAPFRLNKDQFEILTTNEGDLAGLSKTDNLTENMPQPIFKDGCTPVNDVPDPKFGETHTLVCNNQRLNTIVFMDSFFVSLKPYISRHFYRSTYIWERINEASLTKYVEQEKPDIVIDEVVERTFPYMLPSEFFSSYY
ncbi:MAG: hypothetical protein V3V18_09460 [Methylococcales bacterium]